MSTKKELLESKHNQVNLWVKECDRLTISLLSNPILHIFFNSKDYVGVDEVIHKLNNTKEQFINMLLMDDDYYQKFGGDCCEDLTYEERYRIWASNNYETGFEYNPLIVPDFDNQYYEPTPIRKLKWI